jgi:hypothetical protein
MRFLVLVLAASNEKVGRSRGKRRSYSTDALFMRHFILQIAIHREILTVSYGEVIA